MSTPTYTPLATITLTSSASSVTFSSIPATYRDLVIVFNGQRSASGTVGLRVRFNSDTGSNYHVVKMLGDGSVAESSVDSPNDYVEGSANRAISAVSRSNAICQIMDYSATDKHKSVLSRSSRADATEGQAYASASRWANTAAITTVRLYLGSGDFASTSTFSIYGIAA